MPDTQSPVVMVPRIKPEIVARLLDFAEVHAQSEDAEDREEAAAIALICGRMNAPAPADGQVASQRAWLVEERNHEGVLRSIYATVSPDRPYSGPRGVDTIEVTALYTSPTDVSGLVEALEAIVSDLNAYKANGTEYDAGFEAGLSAACYRAERALEALAQAKRDGGEG